MNTKVVVQRLNKIIRTNSHKRKYNLSDIHDILISGGYDATVELMDHRFACNTVSKILVLQFDNKYWTRYQTSDRSISRIAKDIINQITS